MNLIKSLFKGKGERTHTPLAVSAGPVRGLALSGKDEEILSNAGAALDEQLHDVINKNADGVNELAAEIRRQSDMLMSLGISDAAVARAGTLAQLAVEVANAGRGFSLSVEKHLTSVSDRRQHVAQATAIVMKAQLLLQTATKHNKKNINAAIKKQMLAIKTIKNSDFTRHLITHIESE